MVSLDQQQAEAAEGWEEDEEPWEDMESSSAASPARPLLSTTTSKPAGKALKLGGLSHTQQKSSAGSTGQQRLNLKAAESSTDGWDDSGWDEEAKPNAKAATGLGASTAAPRSASSAGTPASSSKGWDDGGDWDSIETKGDSGLSSDKAAEREARKREREAQRSARQQQQQGTGAAKPRRGMGLGAVRKDD